MKVLLHDLLGVRMVADPRMHEQRDALEVAVIELIEVGFASGTQAVEKLLITQFAQFEAAALGATLPIRRFRVGELCVGDAGHAWTPRADPSQWADATRADGLFHPRRKQPAPWLCGRFQSHVADIFPWSA